ncbi:type VI secretion system baseplate subunit TssK [Propylenella binzhouense]|uniref:Type VI secretion system baseplate subunit TssK n=1 Tax=Propylenella binzhouense TaxID=2555902 RepID=A0A964WUR3_9HYPH|nr:type VI secretion system baseplate subunit TssK [Propylenella binzhouense]MYZ49402.1 type VI secretion system baseplate subunit TssK [Propylenella binzhouense]
MSWYSKVAWSEGLFLRQHHLQQNDRYVERLIENRVGSISPYPWGFSQIEIDRDLAQQNKFALRSARGLFQDGTPFDMPGTSPLPLPVDVPEGADRQLVWLTIPAAVANGREVDMAEAASGSRYVRDLETVVDSASGTHVEQEIEVAHPRAGFEIRSTAKSGFHCLKVARILEVRDRTILFDETFAPPVLACHAHPVVSGWLDRVIGWVGTKLETLARYAADPSSGGGLQTFDYFMLQLLNREINVLKHLRSSKYVHPVQVYEEFLRIAGELATFSPRRLAPEYAVYDHDALETIFEPLLSDIQRLLSLDVGRAIRLDLIERAPNAFLAAITDRTLFSRATFVIEVAAAKPLTQIQQQFPALCKVGPNTRMNEIVQTHLPGIELVHMPTPPRQIRAISDHVYFYLDKSSPLWPEFSVASSVGLHFAGDWPGLELDLWAIMEDRR